MKNKEIKIYLITCIEKGIVMVSHGVDIECNSYPLPQVPLQQYNGECAWDNEVGEWYLIGDKNK